MGVAYLICYWLDPFSIAFAFKDLIEYPNLNRLQRWLTIILLLDMLSMPFSAVLRKDSMTTDTQNKINRKSKLVANQSQ